MFYFHFILFITIYSVCIYLDGYKKYKPYSNCHDHHPMTTEMLGEASIRKPESDNILHHIHTKLISPRFFETTTSTREIISNTSREVQLPSKIPESIKTSVN